MPRIIYRPYRPHRIARRVPFLSSGIVTSPIPGVGAGASQAVAFLVGSGAVSGSPAGAATSLATIAGQGAVMGITSAVATGQGGVTGLLPAKAVAAGSAASLGGMLGLGLIGGQVAPEPSAVAFLAGSGALSGRSATETSALVFLFGQGALAGVSGAVATGVGLLLVAPTILLTSGVSFGYGAGVAVIMGQGAVGGRSAVGVTTVAGILASGYLAGVSAGGAAAVAFLPGQGALAGRSVAMSFTPVAIPYGQGSVGGFSAATATGTGLLFAAIPAQEASGRVYAYSTATAFPISLADPNAGRVIVSFPLPAQVDGQDTVQLVAVPERRTR